MAEPIKISTGKYNKEGKVEVDGKLWTVKLPGASTELRLNQAQRRLQVLDKKVQDGTATEADLDRYDDYEKTIYDTFLNIFQDDTEDNSEVSAWINETPMAIIVMALEDIKKQANATGQDTEATDQKSA